MAEKVVPNTKPIGKKDGVPNGGHSTLTTPREIDPNGINCWTSPSEGKMSMFGKDTSST
jgi:hypothetical protein